MVSISLIDNYNLATFSLYRRRRPHRRRRRKFQRPSDPSRDRGRHSSEEIYSSSNYYRAADSPESSSASPQWYNGDYQDEFSDTYRYQGSYEETESFSDYKDAYSWDSQHYENY